MAHRADFYGDQLRLNAFLRVMGKVPERPKRLQRNKQAPSPPLIQDISASADQCSVADPALVIAAHDDDAFLPDRSMPGLESCGTIPENSSLAKDDHVYASGSTSSDTEPSETRPKTNLELERRNSDVVEAISKVKRKKKVVYTVKKKRSRQPMGILNARKKHPLSENVLVLVRASTGDSLPLPGDAEIVSPGLLAGIDPIQDSQLSRLPHELNLVRLDARVKPPTSSNQSTYNPTVKHDPRQPSLVSSRSLTYRMLTSPRAHASSRPHKRLRLPGPGSLCDGFEVGELRISVPEVKSRMRPRENPVGTATAEANFDERRGGLQLACGDLPVSCPSPATIPDASGTSSDEHDLQLELVHRSVETDFQDLRQDSPLLRPTAKNSIRSQLAGITAPLREEDESESFSSQEESNADFSGWGFEDPPKNTISEEPQFPRPGFGSDVGEMGYYGEAMYGMNNRDEDTFWSQYPGLD